MELTKASKTENGNFADAWIRHNLQLYHFPPDETVTVAEVRDLITFRKKVLNVVESIGLRHPKHTSEYQHALDFALRHVNFKVAVTPMSTLMDVQKTPKTADKEKDWSQQRRNDYLSHFVCRLAYCSTPELRQWFVQQEVDLFRFRFCAESSDSVKYFLRLCGIPTDLLAADAEERVDVEAILKQLQSVNRSAPAGSDEPDPKTDIFKVPFIEATDLVRNRRVLVQHGLAFVPYQELASVIVGRFRSNLSRALVIMSKYNDVIQEDSRLAPVLKSASNPDCSATSALSQTHAITADTVELISGESFPPCMRMVYKQLHTKHHLRHQGRMQFGLFLKGIGMTLEESLKFWKREFAPVVDAEKFDKEYAYNIRHNYGKEGKRADYAPYNCLKIITTPAPASSDCHGCPFKIMDAAILRQHLDNWGVHGDQQKTVVDLAQSRQYDRACSRYFEFTHGMSDGSLNQLVAHPNQFFDESRKHKLGGGTSKALATSEVQQRQTS